jgi:hypothetical protein
MSDGSTTSVRLVGPASKPSGRSPMPGSTVRSPPLAEYGRLSRPRRRVDQSQARITGREDPRDQAIAAHEPLACAGSLQFGFGEHGSGGKSAALLSSPGADSLGRPGSSAFTRFGMISSMSPDRYQAVLAPVAVRVP